MAARGQQRPPYGSALALAGWAWENRSYIEGRLALSGGDTDAITLKTFLDISYTLLVDEYREKGGMNLIAALEETRQYASGNGELPDELPVDAVDRKNAESMAQLDKMMKGVQR